MLPSFITNWFRSNNPPVTDGWLAICLPFTKQWEGCSLTAYWDVHGHVWTIGYGATGSHITEGTTWSQAQADQDLMARLSVIGDEIDTAMGGAALTLNDYQKSALADFTYNVGIGTFLESSVLKNLKEGNSEEAIVWLLRYTKSNGVFVQGLENRREAEASLFET